MRTLAGPGASVAFTNLSSATSASLSAALTTDTNANPPTGTTSDSASPVAVAQVECYEQGVLALMQSRNIPHERVCLLDPKASLALSPSDGDTGKFTWFLFGVRPLSPSFVFLAFLLSFFLYSPPSHLQNLLLTLTGLIRVSSVRTTWYYVHTRASKQKLGVRGRVWMRIVYR